MKLRAEISLQAFPFTPHFSPVFSQFHSAPLYLEWAPVGVFLSPALQKRKAGVPGKEDEAGLVPGENCGRLAGSLCASPLLCQAPGYVWSGSLPAVRADLPSLNASPFSSFPLFEWATPPKFDFVASYKVGFILFSGEAIKDSGEAAAQEEEEEEEDEEEEEENIPGCTLFIKNLNFATTEDTLKAVSL